MSERDYQEKSDAESWRTVTFFISFLFLLISGVVFLANFWNTHAWLALLGAIDIILCIFGGWFHWWAEHKIVSR